MYVSNKNLSLKLQKQNFSDVRLALFRKYWVLSAIYDDIFENLSLFHYDQCYHTTNENSDELSGGVRELLNVKKTRAYLSVGQIHKNKMSEIIGRGAKKIG